MVKNPKTFLKPDYNWETPVVGAEDEQEGPMGTIVHTSRISIVREKGPTRISRIRVRYTLNAPAGKTADAREAMGTYLVRCPAAMSVRGCIAIEDALDVSEFAE